MKKTLLALVASQFFFTGVASANLGIPDGLTGLEHKQTFIVTAPEKRLACGINVSKDTALLGEKLNYTLKRNDPNLVPFVNITKWGAGDGKYNPDVTILENIGYNYAPNGVPMHFADKEYVQDNWFKLNQRRGLSLWGNEGDTDLELTVECFTEQSHSYRMAMQPFGGVHATYDQIWDKIEKHNEALTYNRDTGVIGFGNVTDAGAGGADDAGGAGDAGRAGGAGDAGDAGGAGVTPSPDDSGSEDKLTDGSEGSKENNGG